MQDNVDENTAREGRIVHFAGDGRSAVDHVQHGNGQIAVCQGENEKGIILPPYRVLRIAVLTREIATDTQRLLDHLKHFNTATLNDPLHSILLLLCQVIRDGQNALLHRRLHALLTLINQVASNPFYNIAGRPLFLI